MKRIVSVSIGSSRRNHAVELELLGEKFHIERIGTDGDLNRAVEMIRELDGKVDAFGLGGIDLYLRIGRRRYVIREARKLARQARKTPVVDGTGLKDSLERKVVEFLHTDLGITLNDKKVLITAGMDRFGVAEAFSASGCECIFGDLIWALNIPIPIRKLKTLDRLARVAAPVACQLPFSVLYPTGDKQNEVTENGFSRFYNWADIIAGDFLYIRRYMPENMEGKIIVSNTVTAEDVEELRRRGVKLLVTSTPNLQGRSFGTNMMEAVLVALAGKDPEELTPGDYLRLLAELGFQPRVEYLQKKASVASV